MKALDRRLTALEAVPFDDYSNLTDEEINVAIELAMDNLDVSLQHKEGTALVDFRRLRSELYEAASDGRLMDAERLFQEMKCVVLNAE